MFDIHSVKQYWKDMEMVVNGHGKFWKMHMKRSFKVV